MPLNDILKKIDENFLNNKTRLLSFYDSEFDSIQFNSI